jgi:DNA-binding Lrp family transcriptional regulator
MTARAYVLIQTQATRTAEVQRALRGQPGIHAADIVIGPHDLILSVEAADLHAIGTMVMDQIHGIGGVVNTLTYPVVEPPDRAERPPPQA